MAIAFSEKYATIKLLLLAISDNYQVRYQKVGRVYHVGTQ